MGKLTVFAKTSPIISVKDHFEPLIAMLDELIKIDEEAMKKAAEAE
jgi:hypothetical protein